MILAVLSTNQAELNIKSQTRVDERVNENYDTMKNQFSLRRLIHRDDDHKTSVVMSSIFQQHNHVAEA